MWGSRAVRCGGRLTGAAAIVGKIRFASVAKPGRGMLNPFRFAADEGPSARFGIVAFFFLGAGTGDALDLERRPAGFLGDVAVLLDEELVRRLVAVEPAGQHARNLAVRSLRAVLIDHVEHDEFGIQSRLSRHDFSRCSFPHTKKIPAPVRRRRLLVGVIKSESRKRLSGSLYFRA